ncbi:MAG: dephospho-CoA kinase [Acidimicrobiales bacterium]
MIGLTGGVGSGKSTVAELLAALGATVIDTDEIAREVVQPGGIAHAAVIGRFGTLDRFTLADLVFSDAAARRDLNEIVHPAVAATVDERLAGLASADSPDIVVLVVPLLVEAGWTDRVDHVVVVDTPEEVAVRRVVESGRLVEADVRRRIAAQATRAARLAHADTVITNGGSRADLVRQVDAFWRDLRRRKDGGGRFNAEGR